MPNEELYKRIRASRKGSRNNGDGSDSSHVMAWGDDGKGNYYAYPTLFQRENGEWYEPKNPEDEARKKGELYKVNSKQEAIDLAGGSWKLPEKNNIMADKNYNHKDNLKKAYNYMTSKLGYSDTVARALIGNFMQESNLDPSAVNENTEKRPIGIAQWLGERKKKLMERPDWNTLEGQLDFMDLEFKTSEKEAWKAINDADTVHQATVVARKKYERATNKEANDEKRKRWANFGENGEEGPEYKADTEKIRTEIEAKYKDQKATIESQIKEYSKKVSKAPESDKPALTNQLQGLVDSLGKIEENIISEQQERAKSEEDAFKTRDAELQAEKDAKTIANSENEKAVKEALEREQNKKYADDYQQQLDEFVGGFRAEPTEKKKDFVYNKDDFKKKAPVDAIASAALGIVGLLNSDTKIPDYETKVDQATLAYLADMKKISEQGLDPRLEAKAKDGLNANYQVGLEVLSRASGGNRNVVLAGATALDANRAKGIAELGIADFEAALKGKAEYGKTLKEIERVKQRDDRMNYEKDMQEIRRANAEGTALAGSSFQNMMKEIQNQRANAPGSANHMFQTYVNQKLFGQAPDSKANTPGSAEAAAERNKQYNEGLAKANAQYQQQQTMGEALAKLSPEQQAEFAKSGYKLNSLDPALSTSPEGIMGQIKQKDYNDQMISQGYQPIENPEFLDQDTYKVGGKSHRMSMEGGGWMDAREKDQPGGSGLNWYDAHKDAKFYQKVMGADKYGRNLSNLKMVDNGIIQDAGLTANKYDRIQFNVGPKDKATSLDELIEQNRNPYFGTTPWEWRQENK